MKSYLMNETRRKPTTGRQSPSLFDKWHVIFYISSRTDTAGHTKAFDYPVVGQWGKVEVFSSASGTRTDNTSVHSPTCYPLSQPGPPPQMYACMQLRTYGCMYMYVCTCVRTYVRVCIKSIYSYFHKNIQR